MTTHPETGYASKVTRVAREPLTPERSCKGCGDCKGSCAVPVHEDGLTIPDLDLAKAKA